METKNNLQNNQEKIYVAPMLDWTDRHCRFFHRLLSPNAVLYTEMITSGAILYGDVDRHLAYNQEEHPLVLQLGGSEPAELEKCAIIARNYNYDEINLNCGCPSERVQKGAFGACLMREAKLVAQCFTAMSQSRLPVSIKHRIGIDSIEDYEFLRDFVAELYDAGCRKFIVHARNAILKGLSPKQNRDIPPLKYDYVYRLKQEFPQAHITINGGIDSLEAVSEHLTKVDAVMLGRSAYHNPYILNQIDNLIFDTKLDDKENIIQKLCEYSIIQFEKGCYLGSITKHILGLYHGQKNSRLWRQHLSNHILLKNIQNRNDIIDFFNQGNNLLLA
jgi:tRNA-dihydrouridine synthase A